MPQEKKEKDIQIETTLEKIISLLPGHVYWKDRKGVILGCNLSQAISVGYTSPADLIGKTAYDTLPKEQADKLTEIDEKIMASGKPHVIQEISNTAEGKLAYYLSQKAPLLNEKNEIVGIVGVSIDITEQKKVEEKLREAEHKLEGMTLVSASFAHELRTPLASLNISIKNLKSYLPTLLSSYHMAQKAHLPVPEINDRAFQLLEKLLDSMSTETHAASSFIDMMLMNVAPHSAAVASLEEDKNLLFSISSCIDEAISRYPFQAGEKELIHWDRKNDFNVKGRASLIIHVLFNLLKNALYYIATAGKGNIQIWLEKDGKFNKLFFKDTGTGISKEILPNIFEQFFSKTYHGSGIGLSFCKMAMESLEGKIECLSEEDSYTQFTLFFPKIMQPKE